MMRDLIFVTKKIIRVHINPRWMSPWLYVLQPFAQESLDIHLARGFHQKAPAETSATMWMGACRSQYRHAFACWCACDKPDEALGFRRVASGDDDGGKPAIGRKAGIFADEFFLGEIAFAVALLQGLHEGMFGHVGLHQGMARLFTAPGAARDLRHEGPGAFAAAGVG